MGTADILREFIASGLFTPAKYEMAHYTVITLKCLVEMAEFCTQSCCLVLILKC